LALILLTAPLVSWRGVQVSSRLWWTLVLLLALGLFELAPGRARRVLGLTRSAIDLWIAAYLVWCLASVAWSRPPGPALDAAPALLAGVLMFYLAADSLERARWVASAAIAGGLIAAGWAIWQHHALGVQRPAGPFGSPLVAGAYFGCVLLLAGAWALERGSRWAVVAMALPGYALWLTATRAALIAVLPAGALLIDRWAASHGRRARAWAAMLAGAAVLAALGAVYRAELLERLWHGRPLTAERLLYLRDGFELWRRAPLWGHGLGSFSVQISQTLGGDYRSGPPALQHAHNEYLELGCEVGIVGLALFLGLALLALGHGLRGAREAEAGSWPRCLRLGAAAAVVFLLIDNLANVDLRAGVSPLFFWAGLGFLAARPAQRAALRLQGWRSAAAAACAAALLVYAFSVFRQMRAQAEYLEGRRFEVGGDLPAAAHCYRRALDWHPDHLIAASHLGLAEARRGRFREALEAWMAVYRQAPRYAGVAHNLGVLLAEHGRPEEALPLLRLAAAADPDNQRTREWLRRAEKAARAR